MKLLLGLLLFFFFTNLTLKKHYSFERERQRDIALLYQLFMHSLDASCSCPDQR